MTDDYEVGYGRPPKPHQFQPGKSGNPRGRTKGTRNLKTDLLDELNSRIMVTEDGRSRKISKQQALVKTWVNSALKGDGRSSSTLLSLIARVLTPDDNNDTAAPLQPNEQEILEGLKRLMGGEVGQKSSDNGGES